MRFPILAAKIGGRNYYINVALTPILMDTER